MTKLMLKMIMTQLKIKTIVIVLDILIVLVLNHVVKVNLAKLAVFCFFSIIFFSSN
jgi:hypothetical protein